MLSHLQEWLALTLRWVHLIAGISWIGSSFYFMWLDSALEVPEKPRAGVEGELWMVHSGGFYQVEKRLIKPGEMPRVLHWFKWEAFFTWLTGILLLTVVYYLTGGVYLLDSSVSHLTEGVACALGLGAVVVSWVLYDWLWKSALGKNHPSIATAICYTGVIALTYELCHLLSGRAAFIHVGAIFGTVMVLNVWMRILPAQQKMIDATSEGRTPDYALGLAAKRRSVHNSYMTFPVLFIMLSNHYPMTYGSHWNWLVLLLLIVAGAAVRHTMISKNKNAAWAFVPAAAALAAVIFVTAPQAPETPETPAAHIADASGPQVSFAEARTVITQRCLVCHSHSPSDDVFKIAPNGVMFDDPKIIHEMAARIRFRAVESKTMPLANKTGMTDQERALLGRWIDQGARVD